MKKTIWSAFLLLFTVAFLSSCEKDGNDPGAFQNQSPTLFTRMGMSMDAVQVNSSNYQKVEADPLVQPSPNSPYTAGKIEYVENGSVTSTVQFNANGKASYSGMGGNKTMTTEWFDDDTYWIITDPLVKPANCDYIVDGTIQFFEKVSNALVATVDFGDGTCDPYFTLIEDGDTIQLNINDIDDCDHDDDDYYEDDCFVLVYPIDVLMPDGTTLTANDDDELENIFDTWEQNNPNDTNYPSLVFPLDIEWEDDGTIQTVVDEDELYELWEDCEDYYYEDCPDLVFPIDVALPDGSVQTALDEDDLENIFDTWEQNNPGSMVEPTLVFPVSVIYEDGDTEIAQDEDELEEIFEDCGDYDDHEICFDLVYPVNVLLPDGSTVPAQDEDELETIWENWFDNNPSSNQEPTLVFPVTVIYEDGTTDVANDEDDLEEMFEDCEDDDDDDGKINRNNNRPGLKPKGRR